MDFPGEIRNQRYKILLCIPNCRIEISYHKIGRDYQSVKRDGTLETLIKFAFPYFW